MSEKKETWQTLNFKRSTRTGMPLRVASPASIKARQAASTSERKVAITLPRVSILEKSSA